jgi:TfoX/Sxy family transcriptional regulator of competence genes
MPYDEGVAERLRETFSGRKDVTERKMFGGIAFMVSGNMCCGVVNDTLMARAGPDQYEAALKKAHARKMDFTGKPLKGFVYVAPEGYESDKDLADWVKLCMGFVATLPAK